MEVRNSYCSKFHIWGDSFPPVQAKRQSPVVYAQILPKYASLWFNLALSPVRKIAAFQRVHGTHQVVPFPQPFGTNALGRSIKCLISKILSWVSQCAKSFGLGPLGAAK